MMELVFAMVLSACPTGTPPSRIVRIASAVTTASLDSGVDPALLIAVVRNESECDPTRVGLAGEIGLAQIKPDGLGALVAARSDMRDLRDPDKNLRVAGRILARLAVVCGGPPSRWISPYSGRQCGTSSYSRRVLRFSRSF